MQLRYPSGHTGEGYVRAQAWRDASLERCPNHPHGGCSFARHGTYARKTPRGTRIARWYCPESHTTFSLLPDCLAARLPGTLDEVETVVAAAEQAPSRSAAGDVLRPDAVELPGAMRWVERRVRLVHHVLTIVIGLLPQCLARCVAEMGAVRARLDTDTALVALRTLTAAQLHALPAPLGFSQRLIVRHHLNGLDRDELDHYLSHRLRLAGCELPLFEPCAVEALFQSTRGLPRLINRIAHYALTAAALGNARTVTAEHLEHAVAELRL